MSRKTLSRLATKCKKNYKFDIKDIQVFQNKENIQNQKPFLILGSKDDEIVNFDEIQKVVKKFDGKNITLPAGGLIFMLELTNSISPPS